MAIQYPTISKFEDTTWQIVNFPPITIGDISLFQNNLNHELTEVNTEGSTWLRTYKPIITNIITSNQDTSTANYPLELLDEKYSHKLIKTVDTTGSTSGYTGKTTVSKENSKSHLMYKTSTNTAGRLYDAEKQIQFTF